MRNIDPKTVASFGDEWTRFDQSKVLEINEKRAFEEYFAIFPWDQLPIDAVGFDMGCGTGRWARWVAPKVGLLNCIDPSDAIRVAESKLKEHKNVNIIRADVDSNPLVAESQDFGYSLGVLHHIPNTEAGISSCARLLKPGAPFLVYLYYSFDNRPWWFRSVWLATDWARNWICKLPPVAKNIITDLIALVVYVPLARVSLLCEKINVDVSNIPLAQYRNHSFYTMRTDARDRFGTPLEQRFSRTEITNMLERAGLIDIKFSENAPFWCAVGRKAG